MPQLTIFLVKPEIQREQVIQPDANYEYRNFDLGNLRHHIYAKRLDPRTANWWKFFEGHVTEEFVGSSDPPGLVLILEVDKRLYALAFGQGRYALAPDCYHEQFGLKVVLNSVDKVRSIDKKTFNAIAGRTRTQAAKDSEVSEFEFDIERDLLNGVTGTPEADRSLGKRLSGVDSLSATVDVDLRSLPNLLRKYLEQSNATRYKEKFEFVDHMSAVTSGELKDQLNTALIRLLNERGEMLRKNRISPFGFELAIPEVIDFSRTLEFGYSHDRTRTPVRHDIGIDTFIAHRMAKELPNNIEQLKRSAVYGFDEFGLVSGSWSVFECLSGEINHNGEHFVLSDRNWYRIEKDFVKQLDSDINAIPKYEAKLPAYEGGIELAYNKGVAKELGGFHCFDQQLIHPVSRQKIEYCDLYTETFGFRDAIHVKHGTSSAVLSHLFAQGTTSASVCTDYEKCRLDAEKMIAEALGAAAVDPKRPKESRTIYGIIRARPGMLPFFSKVNLRRSCRDLRKSGMGYALAEIDYDPAYLIAKVAPKAKKK